MAQRIELTDNRTQEQIAIEFPQRYTQQVLNFIGNSMGGTYFTIRFNPAVQLSSTELELPRTTRLPPAIIIAAIVAAIEEGLI